MAKAQGWLIPPAIVAGLPCAPLFEDRKTLALWLAGHHLASTASRPRVDVIKARLGRRLTLRLRVGDAVYYGKCYRRDRARSVARKSRKLEGALRRIPGLELASLHVADENTGVLLWSAFPGTPLFSRGSGALSPPETLRVLRRLGRVLAAVHTRRAPWLRSWQIEDEIEVLRTRLAAAPTDVRALAAALASRLPPPGPARLVHRDFYADQILVSRSGSGRLGGLAILDWDDAALGSPALDVGNALAHLELDALREPRLKSRLAQNRRAFLGGYAGKWSAPDASARTAAWRWWEAAALLRLCGLAWTRHHGNDPVLRGRGQRRPSVLTHADEARLLACLAEERLAQSD